MYALKINYADSAADFSFEKFTFFPFIFPKTLYKEKIKCYNGIRARVFYKVLIKNRSTVAKVKNQGEFYATAKPEHPGGRRH